MKKFTIIDYIIIILVICAIVFAFIHITTDDSSDLKKTAFDESTINKIPDTYIKYYKDGLIVNATVEGFNATTGNETTLSGTVVWEDDNGGSDVRLLIESQNSTNLVGLYKYVPEADVYIDHISLEVNGEKYNMTEITVEAEKINSLSDLTSKIGNGSYYEVSCKIAIESLTANQIQEISNLLLQHNKRVSVKTPTSDMDKQLVLSKATAQDIEDASSILGNVNGITDKITIRVYDSTDKELDNIKKNFDVVNVRTF